MAWKKRPRSHENYEEDEEKKKNAVAFRPNSSSLGCKMSSNLSMANLSRLFSSQFLSHPLRPLSPPPPNPSTIFDPKPVIKPPRPPRPNKVQKRREVHPRSTEVGLGILAPIVHKELMSMPMNIGINGALSKPNDIVQRHRYLVIDHGCSPPYLTDVHHGRKCGSRSRSNGSGYDEENNRGGILIISPPSIAKYCESFYPTSLWMSYCHFCDKRLTEMNDIYIYRGEMAFCSEECREEEIDLQKMIRTAKGYISSESEDEKNEKQFKKQGK